MAAPRAVNRRWARREPAAESVRRERATMVQAPFVPAAASAPAGLTLRRSAARRQVRDTCSRRFVAGSYDRADAIGAASVRC